MGYVEPERITITCYHKGEIWLAHCLEMNIVDSGATYEDAMNGMARLLKKHLEYGREHDSNPYHDAPVECWPKP